MGQLLNGLNASYSEIHTSSHAKPDGKTGFAFLYADGRIAPFTAGNTIGLKPETMYQAVFQVTPEGLQWTLTNGRYSFRGREPLPKHEAFEWMEKPIQHRPGEPLLRLSADRTVDAGSAKPQKDDVDVIFYE